jgi:hypothetical protein
LGTVLPERERAADLTMRSIRDEWHIKVTVRQESPRGDARNQQVA